MSGGGAEEGAKTKSVKKIWEKGGVGRNPTTLTVRSQENFDEEAKSEKKNWERGGGRWGGGGGGGAGTETKTVCQTVSNEVKYKNATIYTMWSMWYNQHFKIR